jgi:hypothetical protein
MEVYWLWKSGFKWELTDEDIELLSRDESFFRATVAEADLILKYYSPGEDHDELITATDIKVEIERNTSQRLSLNTIGKELQRLGFEQIHRRVGKTTIRFYLVKRLAQKSSDTEGLPF